MCMGRGMFIGMGMGLQRREAVEWVIGACWGSLIVDLSTKCESDQVLGDNEGHALQAQIWSWTQVHGHRQG